MWQVPGKVPDIYFVANWIACLWLDHSGSDALATDQLGSEGRWDPLLHVWLNVYTHSSLGIPVSEREAKRALMIQQLSAEEIKGMRVAGKVGSLALIGY